MIQCRTCGLEIKYPEGINIFNLLYDEPISHFISNLTKLEISEDDELPKDLCNTCFTKIEDIIQFKNLILDTDNHLKSSAVEFKVKVEEEDTIENDSVVYYLDETVLQHLVTKTEEEVFETVNVVAENLNEKESEVEIDDPLKLYQCEFCGKKFNLLSRLKRHLISHSSEKPFLCEVCNKTFKEKRQLKTHKKTHSQQGRKHKCNDCGKAFYNGFTLNRHIKTHSNERPYLCEVCSKAFKNNYSLLEHQKKHSKSSEKLEPCSICGKKILKYYFNRHMWLHNIDKRFKCEICNRGFKMKSGLNYHMNIHNNLTPYTCDVCDKQFCNPGGLKTHYYVHTKEKRFKCSFCPKAFSYIRAFNVHIRAKHKEYSVVSTNCPISSD